MKQDLLDFDDAWTRIRTLLGSSSASGWAVLGTLLAATLMMAMIHDRAGWGGPIAGEGTYLMQAESLAFDFDLAYERGDFDRFLARWRTSPTDLELASGSDGRRLTYDRPFPYALYLAPFVRFSRHGFAFANVLLLTLAALVAALALRRRIGPQAPLLVAILIFASVSFGYVFRATDDLFLLTVTVVATALITGDRPAPRSWFLAGFLLAIPVATSAIYAVLPLALIAFAGRGGRARLAGGLGLGLVLIFLAGALAGGGLGIVATSGARFSTATGFPLVDFTAAEWPETVHRLDALGYRGAPRLAWGLDPLLWLWNGVYVLFGQTIGLLPYFAPLILILAAWPRRRSAGPAAMRRAPWVAAGLWLVLVLLIRPFDLYGGPDAIGNRLFLPLYGALWLAIARPPRARWLLAAALVAALFLVPLWRTPGEQPWTADGGARHVSTLAARFLPYETSQRWLPGGTTFELDGLWIRPLSESVWGEPHKRRLMVVGDGQADLLIATTLPLDALRLDFGPEAPSRIEMLRGRLGERLLAPGGAISFRVDLGPIPVRHPLWWTRHRQRLYRVAFRLPTADLEPLPFKLVGERRVQKGD